MDNPLFRLDVAVQCSARNMEGFANLIDGVVFIIVQRLCQGDFLWCIQGLCLWSAAYSSSCSGCLESCFGSLSDQITLKLGKRGKDIENEPAIAGSGINTLGQAFKPDLSLVEV